MRASSLSTPLELRSPLPLYKQIESDIVKCLASGEWKPGDQLPTEPELAKRFGVAIYTVRAGIGELVSAGILSRRQGKGTFVNQHEPDFARQNFSKVFDLENRIVKPTGEVLLSFK